MSTSYRASQVQKQGQAGTYRTTSGGTGMGYRINGQVVNSGGNGFYYPVHNLEAFEADNGDGYMRAVAGMTWEPKKTNHRCEGCGQVNDREGQYLPTHAVWVCSRECKGAWLLRQMAKG